MKDMLTIIYKKLSTNPVIALHCEGRIKFYDYPETGETDKPFMIIEPLDVPAAAFYGSDQELAITHHYQVDVQSRVRMICKEVQKAVGEEMQGLGFWQQPNGLDTYFSETARFVDARKYKGTTKLYDTQY